MFSESVVNLYVRLAPYFQTTIIESCSVFVIHWLYYNYWYGVQAYLIYIMHASTHTDNDMFILS